MTFINGGVCAAQGFKAAGIHVGIKTNNKSKKDLALIVSDADCTAAAVYTKNVVKAAPLLLTKAHLKDGAARAVLVNSGNANACAPNGEENADLCCKAAAVALGLIETDIIVASTGVIGQELPARVITAGIPKLTAALSSNGSLDAAEAIMTTDTTVKECAVTLEIGGKTVNIGGIAKGSGMIHPNMGTMLCFLTTDCAISASLLQKALLAAVQVSFSRISVDGDTSTNDMACVLANGLAANSVIDTENDDYKAFADALTALCTKLAIAMASDGEGATHLITCTVSGAPDEATAETLSKSVISSTLTKAAIFGADANWGRVLCAMGYSGVTFDPDTVSVAFESKAGKIDVCQNGRGLAFDEALAKKILTEHDVTIAINMAGGVAACTCWGCDITYDYIKINGDYRT
ncbi:bifunctional glutamate N-acetyltransferase/amino-acid acetyltransferase ArgJ [Oscillospiraceae bacterium CM]|nr:bifunctional glutamate N-acetyltransferase/amino-acid acetyltransferase ArgJ [Oscillospiraceae bacterium CM]